MQLRPPGRHLELAAAGARRPSRDGRGRRGLKVGSLRTCPGRRRELPELPESEAAPANLKLEPGAQMFTQDPKLLNDDLASVLVVGPTVMMVAAAGKNPNCCDVTYLPCVSLA